MFLTIIWFTSRLAQQTEIIAMLSGGMSFPRLLRPYFMAASILVVFSLLLTHYVVPQANKNKLDFEIHGGCQNVGGTCGVTMRKSFPNQVRKISRMDFSQTQKIHHQGMNHSRIKCATTWRIFRQKLLSEQKLTAEIHS